MKKSKILGKAVKAVIRETAEIAGFLWQRGWAERNAGNISVNITDVWQGNITEFSSSPLFNLNLAFPQLAGNYFLVTGTGKRMRDLSRKPLKNMLVFRMNEDGNAYTILAQKDSDVDFMPTSELPTHLQIHQMIASRGTAEKVIMHTHATELISLTQSKELCNQDVLNNLLWSMHPETIMFVPKGIGFVPYQLPGSNEIAIETVNKLQNHDVAVWEKHGVFAIGPSVAETFDLIDILTKSAGIYFLCRSAGIVPEGFTEEQLVELSKLSENF
jgi:rhamnulose-1-phosphate aldolase